MHDIGLSCGLCLNPHELCVAKALPDRRRCNVWHRIGQTWLDFPSTSSSLVACTEGRISVAHSIQAGSFAIAMRYAIGKCSAASIDFKTKPTPEPAASIGLQVAFPHMYTDVISICSRVQQARKNPVVCPFQAQMSGWAKQNSDRQQLPACTATSR